MEDLYKEMLADYNKNNGYLYVNITKGQKIGSIAKLVSKNKPEINMRKDWWDNSKWNVFIQYDGELRWDGRKNKVKGCLNEFTRWLKNYSGDTVFKNVSAKKEKEKALQIPVLDIKGNKLEIGDPVLYINTRYGDGSKLCFGKLSGFEATYSKYYGSTKVYTIVTLDGDDQENKISNPDEYIYKLEEEIK